MRMSRLRRLASSRLTGVRGRATVSVRPRPRGSHPVEECVMLRRVVLLLPVVVFALLVSGCAPSQGEVERSIREEMKSKMGVVITSIELKKQADGSYVGTATAQN